MTTQLKSISEITPVMAFEIVKIMGEVQMEIMVDPREWFATGESVVSAKLMELGVSIFPSQGNLCFALSYIYDREMTDALANKWIALLNRMKTDPEFQNALKDALRAELEFREEEEDLETAFEVIDDQIAELKSIQYLYMTALRGMYN